MSSMEKYEQMLDTLYEKLPKRTSSGERFEAPEFRVIVQGRQTIIQNFIAVVEILRRKPQHLLKYISKEFAVPASLDDKRVIIQGKFRQPQVNSRLKNYIDEYVLCNECGRPDTQLITFEGHKYKQCEGCGARSPVKTL